MKIIEVEQNTPEWLELRKGKSTGSKLSELIVRRGTKKKIGFYKLIAERLSIEDEEEDGPERGHRLEQEALEAYAKATGKTIVKVGFCVSDDNPNIGFSPDGLVKQGKKYVESVDAKCLSAPRHLQALIEQTLPDEYYDQMIQSFIVNEDQKLSTFVFYDPRITAQPLHWIQFTREEVAEDIKFYKEYQEKELKEVDYWVEKLAF